MTKEYGFKGKLITSSVGKNQWLLESDLVYMTKDGRTITVPKGFYTDYASVPRIPLVYSVFGNTAHRAAVLHDYLYSINHDRKDADKLFLEAMRVTGVSRWRAYLMYAAVRAFGCVYYL